MTEPQGGSDPNYFRCRAVRDGDEWVITGEKWFASNFRYSTFLIVMVITNPDVAVYRGSSMILVPSDAEGLEVVNHVGLGSEPLGEGDHPHLRFNDVRVPAENLLGAEGSGFKIAQTRLGGGRVHHAMRSVGTAQRALDMMCERVLSRENQGHPDRRETVDPALDRRLVGADPAVPIAGAALRLADRHRGRLRQDPASTSRV